VRQFNNQISLLLARKNYVPTEEQVLTPEQSKFVFEELIPGFAKRALAVKTNNLKYALLISDSVNLITTFFNYCIEKGSSFQDKIVDIADVMRTVFDVQQKFYQSHF
jgi:hypothetical protein